ncbi:MAG TPA: hypothetical protein VGD78_08775 [Chthoniobacterales bacterium]
MLLIAALIVMLITIGTLRIVIGYLWRPLRPPRPRPNWRRYPWLKIFARALARSLIRMAGQRFSTRK